MSNFLLNASFLKCGLINTFELTYSTKQFLKTPSSSNLTRKLYHYPYIQTYGFKNKLVDTKKEVFGFITHRFFSNQMKTEVLQNEPGDSKEIKVKGRQRKSKLVKQTEINSLIPEKKRQSRSVKQKMTEFKLDPSLREAEDLLKEGEKIGEKVFILGLDISSSCTGWTILDTQGNVIECGVFELKNMKNIFHKALYVRNELQAMKKRFESQEKLRIKWILGVEDFLRSFYFGRQGLFKLAQMNTLVSYDCLEIFRQFPLRISFISARNKFGIKKVEGKKIKEAVLEHVLKELPLNAFPPGMKGSQKVDIADSYIISKFVLLHFHQPQLLQKPPPKKKTKRKKQTPQINSTDEKEEN